jgi:hypothetical protein
MVQAKYYLEVEHKDFRTGVESAADLIRQVSGKEPQVIEKNGSVSLPLPMNDLTIINNEGLPLNSFLVETTDKTNNLTERVMVSVKTK